MIYFNCSKCGERLEAPRNLFNEIVQCPKCSSLEQVPDLSSRDLYKCSKCNREMEFIPPIIIGEWSSWYCRYCDKGR